MNSPKVPAKTTNGAISKNVIPNQIQRIGLALGRNVESVGIGLRYTFATLLSSEIWGQGRELPIFSALASHVIAYLAMLNPG